MGMRSEDDTDAVMSSPALLSGSAALQGTIAAMSSRAINGKAASFFLILLTFLLVLHKMIPPFREHGPAPSFCF